MKNARMALLEPPACLNCLGHRASRSQLRFPFRDDAPRQGNASGIRDLRVGARAAAEVRIRAKERAGLGSGLKLELGLGLESGLELGMGSSLLGDCGVEVRVGVWPSW